MLKTKNNKQADKRDDNLAKFLQSEEYLVKKNIVSKEINRYTINIDRDIFIKTQEEKDKLKVVQLSYKAVYKTNKQSLKNSQQEFLKIITSSNSNYFKHDMWLKIVNL